MIKILLTMQATGMWLAICERNPRFRGYGNSPTEALGHLVQTHPGIFNVAGAVFDMRDSLTQNYVMQLGTDPELTSR